jgi:cyclic dehypoxanthinyl futalosine synthase
MIAANKVEIDLSKRLSVPDALELYRSYSLPDLSFIATEKRKEYASTDIVTYIIDRNINYSNICSSGCEFCAFYKNSDDEAAYILTEEELFNKIDETLSLGGTQILLQGGLNPDLDIKYFENLFTKIKTKFKIHLHALSPPEIKYIADISNSTVEAIIKRLIDAGLDSIPGGGAEILSDRVRSKLSPNKCNSDEWLDTMRIAHKLGLKTTATMMFGHIETVEERFDHMLKIRSLQDETEGFTAFIPWTFQPKNTRIDVPKTSALDYLRILAISRIFFDNMKNIQLSWVTQGSKVAQVALQYGANDFGSLMIEENVVRAAGVSFRMSEEEIAYLIKDSGYIPKRRDMYYNLIGDPICQQK